jgi:two-component system LytT family response regulator
MSALKVIVVDDEKAARNVLSNLLMRCNTSVEIMAQCRDVPEAVLAIREHKPDVVFLDVQMPEYAGYEIVNFFDSIDFEIIFVTAFDQYAIKAFELSAVDYIVKPIDRSRLNEAVEKLNDRLREKTALKEYQLLRDSMRNQEMGKMVISGIVDGQRSKQIIELHTVIAAEALGAYCKLYFEDGTSTVLSRNLSHFESRLPDDSKFFRTHRSWVVNLNHVISFNPGHGDMVLKGNVNAKLSKNRLVAFEEQMKILS